MIRIFPRYPHAFVIMMVLMLMMTAGPAAAAADEPAVALVVSRKIRPYVQVTDGILDRLPRKAADTEVLFLVPGDDTVTAQVMDRLTTGTYDMVAAVGPEAAALIWRTDISAGKKMYAALLDPDAVPQLPENACGISLRIPVAVQVDVLTAAFPSLNKIGLLFDPAHNQWFFEQAVTAGRNRPAPFEIIPLHVTAKNQIAQVLKDNLEHIDAVWMIPDQTVISEKLIQYVVKQALFADTGVIGYNAYFTRVGAFFSFEFDYRELGRQAGEAILDALEGKGCLRLDPVFETRVNTKVVEGLGLAVEETP